MLALPQSACVLITGGTGFLGRHVLTAVAATGVELHAVTLPGSELAGIRVKWHTDDLRDPDKAAALVTELRPTHLVHGAWMAVPGRFWTDSENLDWLRAGLALVRAFGDSGGQRFVGLGSCAEYDWSAERYVEDETAIRPATLYGKSKAAMWAVVEAHAAEAGFSAAWMRIFLPYGPGDSAKRLIPSIISNLREGRPVALGRGTVARDFTWAPDIAALALELLTSKAEGAFNAGTGIGTTVREVAEHIGARLGRPELLEFGARPDPVDEPTQIVADMTKVSTHLGWQASMPVFAGVDALVETK